MHYIKQFAKVGKSLLVKALGIQKNYKDYVTKKVLDKEACKDCILSDEKIYSITNIDKRNKLIELKKHYCANLCKKKYTYIEERVYVNDINRFNLPKREKEYYYTLRLSRLQLIQLLYYHFLCVTEKGFLKNISIIKTAKDIGCSTTSVRNNLKTLAELGYILYSNGRSYDEQSILLLDYEKYHRTQEDGGTGYIVMPKKVIKEIVNLKSVNSVRLFLRNYLDYDSRNINYKKDNKVSKKYRNLKRVLPAHIDYKSIIDKELKATETFLNIDYKANGIIYSLKREFNGKLLKSKLKNKYFKKITRISNKLTFKGLGTDKNNSKLNKMDLDDLLNLSIQYGFNLVEKSIEIIKGRYIEEELFIKNFPALTHRFIQQIIRGEIVA